MEETYRMCVEEIRNVYKSLIGNLKGRHHFEELGPDGGTILNCIVNKQGIRRWA
jgi:hypothetical protein